MVRTCTGVERGFTLIEIVVIVALVSLLAGLVAPVLSGDLEQARLDRAAADTAGIGKALTDFQVTVDDWPSMDGSGSMDQLRVLISGSSVPTSSPFASSHSFWTWASGSGGDLLGNHLVQNSPKSQTAQAYPSSGRAAWRGPYLDSSPLDPWGRPYLVNVISGYSTHATENRRLWVLSAGPDGEIQTASTAGVTDDIAGDDIGFLVQQR